MLNEEECLDFAQRWINAFNSGNLEQVFLLYNDDFTMRSPYIVERCGIETGVLFGKKEVRPYWMAALGQTPTLHFKLLGVYRGVDSLVVHYASRGRKVVCETFRFDENGLVCAGCSQQGLNLAS